MSDDARTQIVFRPSSVVVELDGTTAGEITHDDCYFCMFTPHNNTPLGADEMIEIGNKMKEMEKK